MNILLARHQGKKLSAWRVQLQNQGIWLEGKQACIVIIQDWICWQGFDVIPWSQLVCTIGDVERLPLQWLHGNNLVIQFSAVQRLFTRKILCCGFAEIKWECDILLLCFYRNVKVNTLFSGAISAFKQNQTKSLDNVIIHYAYIHVATLA